MHAKEAVYDSEIYALMIRIIEICKREGIACFCTFDISGEDDDPDNPFLCTTFLPNESGSFPDVIKRLERLVREKSSLVAIMTIKQPPGDQP